MAAEFAGGCMCGEIRYSCKAEPKTVYYCHCEDCRRGSGSAFHVGVGVLKEALTILQGSPKSFRKTADSGNGITRQFCPNCGSPLFTFPDVLPHIVMIKAGSLDEPERFRPDTEIFTDNKVSWAEIGSDIQSYSKGRI